MHYVTRSVKLQGFLVHALISGSPNRIQANSLICLQTEEQKDCVTSHLIHRYVASKGVISKVQVELLHISSVSAYSQRSLNIQFSSVQLSNKRLSTLTKHEILN